MSSLYYYYYFYYHYIRQRGYAFAFGLSAARTTKKVADELEGLDI